MCPKTALWDTKSSAITLTFATSGKAKTGHFGSGRNARPEAAERFQAIENVRQNGSLADTRHNDEANAAFAASAAASALVAVVTPLVNGGIKSGHWAAQKPATLGLGVTRAPRRQSVFRQ